MLDVHGKTAVISGGAEGIGFSLAKAFGGLGMNVVITDIESAALERAEAALKDAGTPALGVEMDVSVREDWQRTADLAEKHFGDVHMLVNNAGFGGAVGPVGSLDESGWRWAIDVNLMGVVYGANTFIPRMRAHDEPAWVINVASIAGMAGVPYAASYTATKAAVVALTEAWAGELAKTQIRVSVLAPAFVKTRIHESYRNRQERFAPTEAPSSQVLAMAKSANHAVESGINPSG
ncbi:MAG: SDR family NAD(P)-dependent oxidoreductase [Myxococcota bacterium]